MYTIVLKKMLLKSYIYVGNVNNSSSKVGTAGNRFKFHLN